MPSLSVHDLLVVGAGPIGLAAAAHASARGLRVAVIEADSRPAAAVRAWGHVRTFSPWRELVDDAAVDLLGATGAWSPPNPEHHPTGEEWVDHYLEPLAAALADAGTVELALGRRVVGLARHGRDRVVAAGRDDVPFVAHTVDVRGARRAVRTHAVVDASGTWGRPNPLGADGVEAEGERDAAHRITYGVPDLSRPDVASRYAGRHVLVAGSGASAQHVLVDLVRLARSHPGTRVTWVLRRAEVGDAFGGGAADQLVGRGSLGTSARAAVAHGPVEVVTGFRASGVTQEADGTLTVVAFHDLDTGRAALVEGVDEAVVVTGHRPDRSWLAQVRLDLDGELDAPRALAPEIHPAWHSCGTVRPHGAAVLRQPDAGLYLAGASSYGRAPSFLAMTGHEQVRSIVAEVAGDQEAADRVDLVLPETGVCHGAGPFDAVGAAGGPGRAPGAPVCC